MIKSRLAKSLNAEFIDWYVQLLEHVGDAAPVYCYMENNKLQDPFFQQVFRPLVAKVRKERGIQLYIRPDERKKTDKATRIEANLEPMNREGSFPSSITALNDLPFFALLSPGDGSPYATRNLNFLRDDQPGRAQKDGQGHPYRGEP